MAPKKRTIRTIPPERTPMAEQAPLERARSFAEVACGYTLADALRDKRTRDLLSENSVEAKPGTQKAFSEKIKLDMAKYAKLVKASGAATKK